MIRNALTKFIAISKNAGFVSASAVPSESQVRRYVADTESKIRVRYVSIPANPFVDEAAPIGEDELQRHFEEYRDVDSETSESGFGYRYSRRAKVQYVVADFNAIAPRMDVSLDAVKAYWKSNKADYTKVVYLQPPVTGESTTQPAPPPTPKLEQKTFSEAKADVERELRDRQAQRVARKAMGDVLDALNKPWFEVEVDPETGYKPIPPGADAPEAMKGVCDRMAAEYGIPLTYGETDFLDDKALRTQQDIRAARVVGSSQLGLGDYALRVPGFHDPMKDDNTQSCLQLFQPPDAILEAGGARNVAGQFQFQIDRLVIFRVIATAQAAPPQSLAEVRDQVEQDVRMQRAFDASEPVAMECLATARHLGVDKAQPYFEDLRKDGKISTMIAPPSFARRVPLSGAAAMEAIDEGRTPLGPPSVSGIGAVEPFVNACFEMAEPGWMPPSLELPTTLRVAKATTQPAVLPSPLVRLVPLRTLKRWIIVELVEEEPVDRDRFETDLRLAAYRRLLSQRAGMMQSRWFDPENIEARCGFEKLAAPIDFGALRGVSPADQPAPYF
jgi:hypothetical protein